MNRIEMRSRSRTGLAWSVGIVAAIGGILTVPISLMFPMSEALIVAVAAAASTVAVLVARWKGSLLAVETIHSLHRIETLETAQAGSTVVAHDSQSD